MWKYLTIYKCQVAACNRVTAGSSSNWRRNNPDQLQFSVKLEPIYIPFKPDLTCACELAVNHIFSLLACWLRILSPMWLVGSLHYSQYPIRDEGSYHTKNLDATPAALLLYMTGKIANTRFPPMCHEHGWYNKPMLSCLGRISNFTVLAISY